MNDAITHFLPVFLDNHPLVALFFVQVEVKVFDEILGEVVTRERDIVIKFAHLEDLMATHARFAAQAFLFLRGRTIPTTFDILEYLETKVVGIERGAGW